MQQMARAGVTSGLIHVVADTLAQTVESRGELSLHWDPKRTLVFGVVGTTLHGPYFQRAFAALDKRFAADQVLKKTAVTQFVVNPPYLILLFSWLGTLEGREFPTGVVENVSEKVVPAFWAGNVFWPIANFLNFRYVKPSHRVAYVASCGALWNTFISMLNKHKDADATVTVEKASRRIDI